MQTINSIPQGFQLTQWFKPIYERYSIKSLPATLNTDARMRRLLNIVHRKAHKPLLAGENVPCRPYSALKKTTQRKAFVAFSGGKDCLATAIRAKEDGYDVTLAYVSGVNKSLPSERRHAEETARAAGFPLCELKVTIGGNKEYNEHPLKNILILCLLVDAGVASGATAFALGNIFEEDCNMGSLDYDLSDGFDMLKAFEHFARGFIDGFKLLAYIHDNRESFYTVYRYDRRLLPLTCTCITPDFRRPMIRRRNIAQYGADVLNSDGCGSCYKCAHEYIFKQSFGIVRASRPYLERCYKAIREFDRNYKTDFTFDRVKYNRYGGKDTEAVQVLCDRLGYYIGRLVFDNGLRKYFSRQFYGSRHYSSRQHAEMVCRRFVSLYKLSES